MSYPTDPARWLANAAQRAPTRRFARDERGRELSYALFYEHTRRFVSALRACGVAPGDRVAVQVEKSLEAILLYCACLESGAVFVPINTANTSNEVEYFLQDAAPRLAVVRPEERAALEPVAARAGVAHLLTLGTSGDGSWMEAVAQCDVAAAAPPPGPADLAAIVYTSGTTGRSKGAMLTRGNLASNAETLAAAWHFSAADVLIHTLPLFHVHGLFVAINTVLASAASLLLMPKFDAPAVVAQFAGASVYMGVPTHYTRMLREPALDGAAAAGMRLFVSGSAPLLAETHREFAARTGHLILERYGMTETVMITSNPYAGPRIPGSVGPPLAGVAVRVAASLEPGAEDGIGPLEVKGPNVFAGYWRAADKTRDAFSADGWFQTGDVGRIDAAGYVYIVGRAKDLVITGGYNVYPKEVETELDALTGVVESAVFGVPHPDFGEGVTAAVVVEAPGELAEADVIRAVRQRLAAYKVPKRVLFVAELPRNTMGKVQKNVLRSTYAGLYGAA